MNEILLIDKPKGITSFDVIRRLRTKLGVRKMGHAGTLDPLATGLLIIGVGDATKQLQQYMNLPKCYEVVIEFGKTSTTYDADGTIETVKEMRAHSAAAQAARRFSSKEASAQRGEESGSASSEPKRALSIDEFEAALKKFIGETAQTPPAFSAIRIKGKRAYDLARKGLKVEIEPRRVIIEKIEILDWNWPLVNLRVACSKGTYIRSLAHDLGQELGCGGYVKALRRTAIGEFRVEEAKSIMS